MILNIAKLGQVHFPNRIRERLGFKSDMELDAVEQPGDILLRHAGQYPSMIQVDGLWVQRGVAVPGANWGRALGDVSSERI